MLLVKPGSESGYPPCEPTRRFWENGFLLLKQLILSPVTGQPVRLLCKNVAIMANSEQHGEDRPQNGAIAFKVHSRAAHADSNRKGC